MQLHGKAAGRVEDGEKAARASLLGGGEDGEGGQGRDEFRRKEQEERHGCMYEIAKRLRGRQ